jgi:hypothetical protein
MNKHTKPKPKVCGANEREETCLPQVSAHVFLSGGVRPAKNRYDAYTPKNKTDGTKSIWGHGAQKRRRGGEGGHIVSQTVTQWCRQSSRLAAENVLVKPE